MLSSSVEASFLMSSAAKLHASRPTFCRDMRPLAAAAPNLAACAATSGASFPSSNSTSKKYLPSPRAACFTDSGFPPFPINFTTSVASKTMLSNGFPDALASPPSARAATAAPASHARCRTRPHSSADRAASRPALSATSCEPISLSAFHLFRAYQQQNTKTGGSLREQSSSSKADVIVSPAAAAAISAALCWPVVDCQA